MRNSVGSRCTSARTTLHAMRHAIHHNIAGRHPSSVSRANASMARRRARSLPIENGLVIIVGADIEARMRSVSSVRAVSITMGVARFLARAQTSAKPHARRLRQHPIQHHRPARSRRRQPTLPSPSLATKRDSPPFEIVRTNPRGRCPRPNVWALAAGDRPYSAASAARPLRAILHP